MPDTAGSTARLHPTHARSAVALRVSLTRLRRTTSQDDVIDELGQHRALRLEAVASQPQLVLERLAHLKS